MRRYARCWTCCWKSWAYSRVWHVCILLDGWLMVEEREMKSLAEGGMKHRLARGSGRNIVI